MQINSLDKTIAALVKYNQAPEFINQNQSPETEEAVEQGLLDKGKTDQDTNATERVAFFDPITAAWSMLQQFLPRETDLDITPTEEPALSPKSWTPSFCRESDKARKTSYVISVKFPLKENTEIRSGNVFTLTHKVPRLDYTRDEWRQIANIITFNAPYQRIVVNKRIRYAKTVSHYGSKGAK